MSPNPSTIAMQDEEEAPERRGAARYNARRIPPRFPLPPHFDSETAAIIAGEHPPLDTQADIREVCQEIADFLVRKNIQYGNSAIDPVRIFSKADPEEQIKVRIDDKISRLVRGDDSIETDDDIVDDVIGYFVLLKVIRRRKASH